MDEQSFSVSFFIITPLTKKRSSCIQKKKKKEKKLKRRPIAKSQLETCGTIYGKTEADSKA